MTSEELRKGRTYYRSLLSLQRSLQSNKTSNPSFHIGVVKMLADEVGRIEKDFPGLVLPCPFDLREMWHMKGEVLVYLGSCLARLEGSIDTTDGMPVTESREFTFIGDAELRKIVERDYSEIQRALIAGCNKSVIILAGSAIEAILVDCLLADEARARGSRKAPTETDIRRWDLNDLINVGVDLNIVTIGVEKLSHSVRQYRNLVHPGNEIRNNLVFDKEEAKIAVEVLHIIHRDLSK